ncbi:CBS domain-containing protein [Streptomyces avicenniae]|uniref:CBS domain-containing protein n=1 Tax=Streptomyces avicenniae TaxID=500153 RepID=UPI00069A76D2|nr:CBS domain-containing protein [Streptomyces avicenniae]
MDSYGAARGRTVRVGEVMTPVVTALRPDASLVEAARLMRDQGVGEVLVAQDGVLLGMLTDRDITVRAVAEGLDPLLVRCHAVCTPDPLVVAPGDEVAVASRLLRAAAVRRLPVVDGDTVVGMVCADDVPA